jgi:colanic acid/amylovoran biosynthesis protein
MKITITGITGCRNRGVEAMVWVSTRQLLKYFPESEIEVITETPDYDQNLDMPSVVTYKSRLNINTIKDRIRRRFSRFSQTLSPDYSTFSRSAMVISSGGDIFSSDYGVGFLKQELEPLKLAIHGKVPTCFLAQSIGPFKTRAEELMWLEVARKSALITVREKFSYDYITEKLGLSKEIVKHTADPAFILEPASQQHLDNLLNYYQIPQDRPKVAITPSQGITKYTNKEGKNNYEYHLDCWQKTVEMIIDEFCAMVLIVPHVHDGRYGNDDTIIGTNLLKRLKFNPQVRMVGENLFSSEYKAIIGSCDMVISERMHSCIAGLSSGVCTIPISYSVKAGGIMADIFGSSHEDLVISFPDFISEDREKADTIIRNAWQNRQQISAQIQKILPTIQEKAEENYKLIAEIIKK